jgi:hypothetical protein
LNASLRVQQAKTRRPALVATAATLGMLAFTGWTFASPTPYPIVARAFDLDGLSKVKTPYPEVGLVVDAAQPQIPAIARSLARRDVHVSFVMSTEPSARVLHAVARFRDDLLPAASPGGPTSMLRFRTRLVTAARSLGLHHRFYYLRPRSGFTLADYLAARAAGGVPISASLEIGAPDQDPGTLRSGTVLLVDANSLQAPDSLAAAVALLASRRLRGVPVGALLASAATRARPTAVERASAMAATPITARDATSPKSRSAEADHHSRARSGASATGTNVVRANTSGAT